ncbi:NERD domain-containing protein [Leifsonia sp. 22587]|uniref:NERD domain-containing protein n=1 Tax=Leifsonia sp. 22587 TaxID=3453946 RepID=UPI003F87A0DA
MGGRWMREREVGRLLTRLPEGWSAFRSAAAASGGPATDPDHLVVGPGGVFVVRTRRHHRARLTVDERSLVADGVRQPSLRDAELQASRLRGLLFRAGVEAPVLPVTVVVGARELRMRAMPARAAVLRSENLLRWLTHRPACVDAATVARAVALFADPASWQPLTTRDDERAFPLRPVRRWSASSA